MRRSQLFPVGFGEQLRRRTPLRSAVAELAAVAACHHAVADAAASESKAVGGYEHGDAEDDLGLLRPRVILVVINPHGAR
jgi:hypothetical protein